MKKLLIILLFIGFNAFSQTFEVVNKGYYYGQVGNVKLPNRTTDLKALTDVQEYLEANNLENGQVVRPPLEVSRKKSPTTPPQVIRDTVLVHMPIIVKDTVYVGAGGSEISIGNQWMGEPITETKATGSIIADKYGSSDRVGGGAETAFDGNLNTFRRAYVQQGAWVGLNFGKVETIVKVRIYPHPQFNTPTMTLNGCLIQYSNDGSKWTTVHTIADAQLDTWYEVSLTGIQAQYFRVYAQPSYSYGGHIAELEFYRLM